MARIKEEFDEQIERKFNTVIAPQEDKLNIPSYEGDYKNDEPFFGDDEPAF